MKEFEKAYRKVMNTRMFYEHAFSDYKNHPIPIDYISIKTADEFYKKIIIIDDDNDNIIFEAHNDAAFNKALINKIFNASSFTQIRPNDVFSRCSDSIKSNYKIQRNIPIYVFDFSFQNNSNFICSIFASFKIEFSKKDGTLKEIYENEAKIFSKRYGDHSGLCADAGTCVLALFNSDKKTETTVVHELYHYLQIILKKEKHELEKSKFEDIRELQFNVDDLEYLFDDYEFETHIKVNLVDQLEEMYWKFYKQDISKQEFIEQFISFVRKDPFNVVNAFFDKLIDMKHNDTTQLRMFAACFKIKDKQYLLDAIIWLREAFK